MPIRRFPTLQTERLVLRELAADDVDALSRLRSDAVVNRYIVRPKEASLEDTLAWLKKISDSVNTGELLYWAIALRNAPALIGTTCVFRFSEDRTTAELGYELSPAHHRQGLISEAVAAVVQFVQANTTIQKLKAFTHEDNAGSIGVLAKNGFRLNPHERDATPEGFIVYETALGR